MIFGIEIGRIFSECIFKEMLGMFFKRVVFNCLISIVEIGCRVICVLSIRVIFSV